MKLDNDNLKAGVFVLAGIVLGVVVIFLLSDFSSYFEEQQTVRVFYSLSDGLRGLKEGATVTLGDQPVGSVVDIQDVPDPQDADRIVGQVVTLQIPERIDLYWNARIEIKSPPIGSGTKLNIASVGDGKAYDPEQPIPAEKLAQFKLDPALHDRLARVLPKGVIPGAIAASDLSKSFAKEIGIGDVQRQQIAKLIGNAAALSDSLKRDLPDITARVKDDLPKISAKVEKVLDEFGQLAKPAKDTLDDLRIAAANVRETTATIKENRARWSKRIDDTLDNLQQASATIRSNLKDVDPKIRSTADDIAAITKEVRSKTLPQIAKTLEKADEGVTSFSDAADRVARILASQTPVIERMMANLQLTADQLKLTSIEVRRSPWRLLYRPSDEELETDNLYDATRSFALAAGALQSASASLDALVKARPNDEDAIKAKLEHLNELFKRFKEAETKFWKELKALER